MENSGEKNDTMASDFFVIIIHPQSSFCPMAKRRSGYKKKTILQKGTGAILGGPFIYLHA